MGQCGDVTLRKNNDNTKVPGDTCGSVSLV